MKNRLIIIRLCVMVALLGVTGEVNAAETPRKIVNDLTNGSATWYSDASKSAEITSVPYAAAEQTLYIDIQPAEGYWTSADELNGLVEKYVSPSAAESRTRSADISIAQYQVKTVSGQTYADNGGGLYQVTIPGMGASTDADKITKFVLTADFVACTDIGGDDSGGGGGGGSGITATAESTVYNGQNQTAVLKLGDTELTKGTDYTVDAGSSDTYKDADTYTIAITGKGRYKGTANVDYTIAKKEVGLTWTNNTPYLFNGSAQAPSVKVKDGDLVSGDACTVGVTIAAKTGSHLSSNKEAVDVGEYTATATGLSNSNYKLKDDADVSEDFSIVVNSSDVVVVTITGHNSTATYDGQSHSVSGYDVTSISNALYAESDFTFNGTATATRTDAGTTNMGLAASQFTNTNANFSVTFNVTDGFVTINRKGVNPNPDSGNGEGKVSITVDPTSFEYNGKAQKPTVTVKDGETANAPVIDAAEYTVSYKNSKGETVNETKNVGTYTIVITNKDGGNYVVNGTATYDITQKALTVTAKAKTIAYGSEASNDGVTYSGFVEGESATTEGLFSGSLTYQYNSKADGSGEAYKTSSPVGTYYIIPSGLSAKNYVISYVAGTLTVSNQVIVIGGGDDAEANATVSVTPTEFTYNGKAQKPEVKITLKDGNTVIPASEYDLKYKDAEGHEVSVTKNAGSYTLEISNKAGADYAFSGKTTANYTIKQKALTVMAKAKAISYGSEASNNGVEYSGFAEGESETTEGVFSGTLSYAYNSKEDGTGDAYTTSSPVGTYYIIPSGLMSGNYAITYKAGVLTVSDKVVVIGGEGDVDADATISVSPTEFTYNGKDQKPEVKITLKDGNTVISANEYDVKYKDAEGHEVSVTKNAGSYTLEITNKEGADYAFSGKTTANYAIKQKALTVTAKAKTISYGSEASNDGVEYSGFAEGESETTEGVFSGTLSYAYNSKEDGTGDAYTTSSPVGTYYIIPSGLMSGNYAITYKAGVLTVSDKVVVIGGEGDVDADATISVSPTEFTYNGKDQKPEVKITLKDGNTVISANEYDVKYKDAEGHEVSVTKNAGSYTLEITNKEGADYAFSGKTTANYAIKQKALTVTAKAKTISYGSEASNDGVEYSGFAEGESETTEGVFSGTLSYAYNSKEDGTGDAYTTSSPVGTYYIIPSGLMSGNYAITYKAGVLTVSDKVVVIGGEGDVDADATISVSPTEFTYNGKDQKPEVKITLKDGNTVISANEYDVKYKDAEGHEVSVTKNAGSYTLEITNKEGADYAFSGKTTANYTIKPKALTVKAEDKTKKVGEEDPEFTYTYDGLVEGDKDVFSGALTRDEGETAGTYTIKLGTLSAGTNYTITYTGATLTIEEEPSPAPTPEEPEYTIKVVKTDGGKVTSNRGKAKKGKQVKLTVAADEDYYLTSISVVNDKTEKEVNTSTAYDKENNLYYTFTMPAANVTVKATFAKKEKDQNIFIFRNNYGEIASNVLHADPGQQVNLVRRLKNGYTNTELDELHVINDEGQQLQLFFYDNLNDVEHPVWFFFMKGKSVQIYNSFKGTNGVVDQSKSNSLRLEDGTLLFLLSDLYKSFFKTGEGTEAAQLAMSYVANILANFNASGELSVDKGPDDVDMALLNLLEGWKVMIDFEGVIKILNAEMLGLSDGARLTSDKIYELLTPGNLHLLLHSAYGPLLIKSITLIAPEPEPEEPVAINGLKADGVEGDVYDLRGRKVDTNSLRKGIYIRDGRKIVIK